MLNFLPKVPELNPITETLAKLLIDQTVPTEIILDKLMDDSQPNEAIEWLMENKYIPLNWTGKAQDRLYQHSTKYLASLKLEKFCKYIKDNNNLKSDKGHQGYIITFLILEYQTNKNNTKLFWQLEAFKEWQAPGSVNWKAYIYQATYTESRNEWHNRMKAIRTIARIFKLKQIIKEARYRRHYGPRRLHPSAYMDD